MSTDHPKQICSNVTIRTHDHLKRLARLTFSSVSAIVRELCDVYAHQLEADIRANGRAVNPNTAEARRLAHNRQVHKNFRRRHGQGTRAQSKAKKKPAKS